MLQGAQRGLRLGLDVAAHELAGLHIEGWRAGDVDHAVRLRYEREWHAELANHAGKNRNFDDLLRHADLLGCLPEVPTSPGAGRHSLNRPPPPASIVGRYQYLDGPCSGKPRRPLFRPSAARALGSIGLMGESNKPIS